MFEDDVFIENTRLVDSSKTQDLNLRADVVLSMSRGPPGQWFPETEYWVSAIFVGTSDIPPKIIYRSVKSYTLSPWHSTLKPHRPSCLSPTATRTTHLWMTSSFPSLNSKHDFCYVYSEALLAQTTSHFNSANLFWRPLFLTPKSTGLPTTGNTPNACSNLLYLFFLFTSTTSTKTNSQLVGGVSECIYFPQLFWCLV